MFALRERQREGIALAKAKGTVYKGRKPALNAERIAQLREWAAAGANRTELAKFGISRETLYQYIRSKDQEKPKHVAPIKRETAE